MYAAEDRDTLCRGVISTVVENRWATAERPHWYALVVKPLFEKPAARTLERKGYETFLPLYGRRRGSHRQSTDSDLPLFPGYVCCRFCPQARLGVLTTPGVIRIAGFGETASPLAEQEIASLQTVLRARFPIQPFPYVGTGQKVRITQGPLAGIEGIVIGWKQNLRLILSISLFERSALLEVERNQFHSLQASNQTSGAPTGDSGCLPFDLVEGY